MITEYNNMITIIKIVKKTENIGHIIDIDKSITQEIKKLKIVT